MEYSTAKLFRPHDLVHENREEEEMGCTAGLRQKP